MSVSVARLRLRLAVAVLVVGLGAAACHSGSLRSGEARLSVDGDTQVAVGTKDFKAVRGTKILHAGDRVRVDGGSAKIALSDGGHLELRQSSVLRFAAVPFVEGGDLLVEPGRQATEVATDGATVRVLDGAAHLSRTLAFAVTAYRGTSTITSAGSAPLAVRAPRQATLPARGVLPDHADPADYHADDGWDRRYFGIPIEIGKQLETAATGFMQQLPAGEGKTPGFFRLLLPSLEKQPSLDQVLTPSFGPAENLVGATIALRSDRGSFADRWHDLFAFRDPGGREVNWGLVALDQGIDDPTVLTGDVDVAIGRAPKQFALAAGIGSGSGTGGAGSGFGSGFDGSGSFDNGGPGGGSNSPPTSATTAPSSPRSSTTTSTTPPTTQPSTVPTVPTTPPAIPTTPPTTLPPPQTGTPADSVVDPLVDTVDSLLQGTPPPPSPPSLPGLQGG